MTLKIDVFQKIVTRYWRTRGTDSFRRGRMSQIVVRHCNHFHSGGAAFGPFTRMVEKRK